MTKIAMLLPDLDCGGAQRVILDLANGLHDMGVEVDLVVARGGGVLESQIPPNTNLIRLCKKHPPYLILGLLSYLALRKYISTKRPVALLSSVTGTNILSVLVRSTIPHQFRLVLRHENTSENINSNWWRWLIRKTYPRADLVITISPRAKSDLIKTAGLANSFVRTIENPVNISRITNQADEPLSLDADFTDATPTFLAVGRLSPQKDFDTLIEAFRFVNRTVQSRLMILGEGACRHQLELKLRRLGLEGSVYMPGVIPNPYPYFRRANVFVMSSRWEGLPIALMEAMALGLPIVSTDCNSGPRELLDDGRLGHLVPIGNSKALANAMLLALRSEHDPVPLIDRAKHYDLGPVLREHAHALGLLTDAEWLDSSQ